MGITKSYFNFVNYRPYMYERPIIHQFGGSVLYISENGITCKYEANTYSLTFLLCCLISIQWNGRRRVNIEIQRLCRIPYLREWWRTMESNIHWIICVLNSTRLNPFHIGNYYFVFNQHYSHGGNHVPYLKIFMMSVALFTLPSAVIYVMAVTTNNLRPWSES